MRDRLDAWFWALPGEVIAGLCTVAVAPWWYLAGVLLAWGW